MRTWLPLIALTFMLTSIASGQETPSPSDVAPPPEIVIPTTPELIPPTSREPVKLGEEAKGKQFLKIGTLVTGDVELFPKVRIKSARAIHPRAVPMIIAVMDPHEGPWHPHTKIRQFLAGEIPDDPPTPVVFVKVMLPPEALPSLQVKREEIEFEYGGREINIDSDDGIVTIDYDD